MPTFNPISTYTVAGGPIAASSTPGAIAASGWIDIAGNQWSVDASNRLKPAQLGGSPNNTARLGISGETANETRIDTTFIAGSDTAATLFHMHRVSGSAAAPNAYVCGLKGDGGINLYSSLAGTITGGVVANLGTLTAGTTYILRTDVVQTNSTTTTLTYTLFAADGTTVIGTYNTTNTVAALQNAPGNPAICIYQNAVATSPSITKMATYDTNAAATALTLSGPSSGLAGTASTAFTVAANGAVPISTSVVVTPSDGGAGGTFTPATVTLTPTSTTGTFTYTAASAGAKTISVTNNASLSNPAALTFTASAAITIPVTSTAFKLSPGNWRGDTGRGGSAWRQSWVNGAWFQFSFNASASPTLTIPIATNSSANFLSYEINGKLYDNIAATGPITVQGIVPNTKNTIIVRLRNSSQLSRWNTGTNVVRITGMVMDSNSSAAVADAARPWVLFVGDSITEGIGVFTSLQAYTYYVMRALDAIGYDTGIDACGGSGWLRPGDQLGDVPAWYNTPGGVYADATSRWNKVDQGISRLDANGHLSSYGATGTEPAAIFINYATNEALSASSTSDMTASVSQAITAMRAAAPNAVIGIIMPFGLRYAASYSVAYVNALLAGVSAYQAANPNDTNVVMLDLGATFAAQYQTTPLIGSDGIHPTTYGGAVSGALVTQQVLAALGPRRFAIKVS